MSLEGDRHIRQLERRIERLSSIRDHIGEVLEQNLDRIKLRPLPKRPGRAQRKHREYEAVLTIADLQWGKVTDSYDSDVAYDRLMQLIDPVVSIADRFAVNKLHVWLLGDLVEGSVIYPAQSWSVDSPAFEQAMFGVSQGIYDLLVRLMERFRVIEVSEVAGNHGRAGSTKAGVPVRDNWDSVAAAAVYLMLKQARAEGRVRMQLNDKWYEHREVCKNGCLLFHGHQLRSLASSTVQKRLLGWATDHNIPDWRYAFCGHWHNPSVFSINDRYLYVSGSLDSDDKYAQESLSLTGEPLQRMYIFHERGGMVSSSMLRVDR